MKEQILLVGAFHEAVELCELCGLEIVGMFDNAKRGDYCGYPILGDDSSAVGASDALKRIPVLLTPDQPTLRKRLAERYAQLGFCFRSARLQVGRARPGRVHPERLQRFGSGAAGRLRASEQPCQCHA